MKSKAEQWAQEQVELTIEDGAKKYVPAKLTPKGGVHISGVNYTPEESKEIAEWFKNMFLVPEEPKLHKMAFGSTEPAWEDVTPEWAAKESRETRRRNIYQTIRACAQAGHSHASMLKQGNADLASELRKKGFTVTEEQQSQYYKISW